MPKRKRPSLKGWTMRPITKLVVHCSDTPDGKDIGFKEINRWHKLRGWKSPSGIHCGYHYILRRDGTLETGRPLEEVGAHVEGANKDSVGVCLVGRRNFAPAQIVELKILLRALLKKFPNATVYGHREFESAKRQGKTCPNFDVHHLLGDLYGNQIDQAGA